MIYNKQQNLSLINNKKFKEKMHQYMLYQIQINHIYYFNILFHNPFFEHFKNQFMNFEKFLANFQKQRNNALVNEEKIIIIKINEEINENQFNKTINNSIDTDISSNSNNSSSQDGSENEKNDFSKTNNLLTNFSNSNAYNNNEIKKSQKIEKETKKNSISLNKEIEKYKGNPIYENTEILRVSVKISKDNTVFFKVKRYDDVFETIKLFCEINVLCKRQVILEFNSLKLLTSELFSNTLNCSHNSFIIKEIVFFIKFALIESENRGLGRINDIG